MVWLVAADRLTVKTAVVVPLSPSVTVMLSMVRVMGAGTLSAALTFRRPPVAVMPAKEEVGVVVLRMAVRISSAVALGFAAAYRATAPVTWGVAMEVP